MSVTREEIAAYADGELSGPALDRVAAAIAADPALRAEIDAHRAMKARLASHFAPIEAEPVPERLTRLVPKAGEGGEVIDFAKARSRRVPSGQAQRRQWLRWAGPALAASLILAIMVSRPAGNRDDYATGTLAKALETGISGPSAGRDGVRLVLTVPNASGELCRGFEAPDGSGIACRDRTGWRLERRLPGVAGPDTQYRQAGSPSAALMEAMQALAAGGALDAQGEVAARSRGWRP